MMDLVKAKEGNNKKGLMVKTWERCRSLGGSSKNNNISGIRRALAKKSKSWPRLLSEGGLEEKNYGSKKRRIAPEGCLSVYVGPQKQRFVIKTEYVNHPLFEVLLEEAESEYGCYRTRGPLALPCSVDVFLKLLLEMDSDYHVIHHKFD